MKSVLFIDVDRVMSAGIEHHQFGGDSRVTLAEHLGNGIADTTYSWDMGPFMLEGQDFREVNKGLGESLCRILAETPKARALLIVCFTRTKSDTETVFEMFAQIACHYYNDSFRIDELVHIAGDVSVAVREYLEAHAHLGIEDYAVLTQGERWLGRRNHNVQSWGLRGELSRRDELMTVRLLLEHAPWYEWANRAAIADPWDNADPYGSDRYDKVILLDIYGVLNDEGPSRLEGVYIDPKMVDNLAHIVRQTGAQIVLTSSWKYSYMRFARDGFKTDSKHLLMLQGELDRCDLSIDGMTPDTSLSGPRARPLEIMEWLRRYWRTNAYVILEDDTFWEWGWLRNNVVTTQTNLGVDRYERPIAKKGLTEGHALRAISILEAGASNA